MLPAWSRCIKRALGNSAGVPRPPQYPARAERIVLSDPVKFLFDVREPRGTLGDVSESVMRKVVGDRTVDEVITIGRQEIETEALAKMQALSTKYAMGISIDQVQLKNINPPEPVQVSFNEVNQAQQEKEKLINEARRDYNKVIPLAEGEKDQRIREADGYRLKRINEAEGDVARFGALLAEYVKAPEVTRRKVDACYLRGQVDPYVGVM